MQVPFYLLYTVILSMCSLAFGQNFDLPATQCYQCNSLIHGQEGCNRELYQSNVQHCMRSATTRCVVRMYGGHHVERECGQKLGMERCHNDAGHKACFCDGDLCNDSLCHNC
ncbi:unnamed protein product [Meganyctiphanes norvegica]|uniref:Protein sleepless n=1 Tax=Meganyctiphanes norvegica TaxID=48144 RepID=A0AAV2QNE3_MEGNR